MVDARCWLILQLMVVFFFGVFIFFSCQVAEGCALSFFTFAADLPGRAEEGLFFEKKKV